MLADVSAQAAVTARQRHTAAKSHTVVASHTKDCIKKPNSKPHAAAPAKRRHRDSDCATVPPPPPVAELPGQLGVLQKAIRLAHADKVSEAAELAPSLTDPVARTLLEWVRLRNADTRERFERYDAFIRANPGWPSAVLRRLAEVRLWQEHRDGATVRRFVAGEPTTSKGRLALARTRIADGDRAGGERDIRNVWRADDLSAETEDAVIEAFGTVLTRADHLARMDRRIGAKDFGTAMRAARRVDDDAVAIVKACVASEKNASDAKKLLDAVPDDARGDLGYALCRIHYLVKHDDLEAAARLALAADPKALQAQDTDEWWRERRMLARKLLDQGEAKRAYLVVRDAAEPALPPYRADFYFMAGWIALRFLSDPVTALAHFSNIDTGSSAPITLAKGAYWRGRALEAAGRLDEMREQYASAAAFPVAYYGQLARERLGLGEMALHPMPQGTPGERNDLVHAAALLYAIGERDLALSFSLDVAAHSDTVPVVAALANVAQRNGDARAVLLIGKRALERGLPFEAYAFPDIGVPSYTAIGPPVDRSIIYSIVRTESEFNQRDVSPAKAVGLMQVTPEAGRDTAKRLGIAYDWKRLVADPIYNMQLGAGELAALLAEYRGSYIMSFAGYNAGRGRVHEWVAKHGDPRNAKVDAVDWVERIPLSETRNYVQRVMENLAVYRVRFASGAVSARRGADEKKTTALSANPGAELREAVAR
ncbi:MAG TPA: transglycosylase SLT domain-containing protein [Xanthobacteraceae bacterium]|jgi:soluble lytic murein transglycosylase